MSFGRMMVASVLLVLACAGPGLAQSFTETFDGRWTLEESSSMGNSGNPNWWLNEGGYIHSKGGVGSTILGDLPWGDRWREEYSRALSWDSDGGKHPQNLVRLVSKHRWKNVRQGIYFRVKKTNLSETSQRNGSNGVLLFNRYQDGNNLYYAGIRVDGKVVVKKKLRGRYYTLGDAKVVSGRYDRWSNPNLLPQNRWIGVKSRVYDVAGGVRIEVSVNWMDGDGWKTVLSTTDAGRWGTPIWNAGYGGIRTDFMDLEFENYVAAALSPSGD